MRVLRTIVFFAYFFGYLIRMIPLMRRCEKALAAGTLETMRETIDSHVTRWCSVLLKLSGSRITVEGKENIPDGNCVFVANHRSLYDIPLMLTSLDRPHGLLAKKESEKLPLINRWMKLLGCIFVQRDDPKASMRALNAGADLVREGKSFIIFPEGTRFKGEEGGIGEFKGGAFRIALKTGVPVVPVMLAGARGTFEDNHYLLVPRDVTVRILPPIETVSLTREEQKALPGKVQQLIHDELQKVTAK
ncbi:MAG: 1-acyl-sn-glycerol-3-phosphate acyltransferase [Oscillospiraceae bacterium]|nr:1-acyl-sn-glycerol-3-phosphate acyltransferase [Oscillospiraceae bacterium]